MAGAVSALLAMWVARRVRRHTVATPAARRIAAWFVTGVLVVAVAAFGVLAWLAVDWIVAQPDWVLRVAGLGPLATASAAVVALLVGWATILQKRHNDLRDQWWKRVQWALDHVATAGAQDPSATIRRKIGQNAVAYLGRETALSTVEDLHFLQAAYPATLVHDVEERLGRELHEPDRIEDVRLDVEIDDDASGK